MSSAAHKPDEAYEQLLAISRRAAGEKTYELAYHSLCAAMWRAWGLKDPSLLRSVLKEASRQQQDIDTTATSHRLSSSTALAHGHESVYSSLEREIHVHLQLWESQDLLDNLKRRAGQE